MDPTVSDYLLERLHAWGVRRIYGYPGDGINGLIGAFDRMGERMRFIQARHEELAAFMACAHAKFTGEVGVCLATSGPGAIHLLNGLYDARADHQPVVAIVGQQKRMAIGGDYQQEVDLISLFKDVAHEFVHMATTAEQVRHLIDRAMRIARDRRAVTCVIVPNDVQDLPAAEPPREHGAVPSGIGRTVIGEVPAEVDLAEAAHLLNRGERVAMLVGAGALGATDEVIAVADKLGAGVAKALLGKAAVPDDLPFVTGSIGVLGTKASWDLMNECDTLLMVGSAFPYSEFLPPEGQARGVQIDIDARMIGLRYPMELGLVGDARETLRALLPLLEHKPAAAWRERVAGWVERWWRVVDSRAMNPADPINPQRVFRELSPRLPDNAIIACDTGTVTDWYARDLRLRRGMMASVSGGLSSMGSALPYALAAKFAHPDRPVIALVGDGAMQMNGISSLITVARHWREWSDPRLPVLVLNNGDLNEVTWEQRTLGGDRRFADSQELPDFPYAAYGRLLGLGGLRVERPEDIAAGWDLALSADRPTVVEVLTDPKVPPMPPHVTLKQAVSYARALRGDPDARALIIASLRETWDSLFPGSKS
ncbi:MAG: thiamine pyrophosphate-requiring protein [Thauera sp.]|nr:thiamine pyrophosphate-requiring protein [Thauera sp.]